MVLLCGRKAPSFRRSRRPEGGAAGLRPTELSDQNGDFRGRNVSRTFCKKPRPTNCLIKLLKLVALTGIEPVLSALRGRRVNQLHHSATCRYLYHIPRKTSIRAFNVCVFQRMIHGKHVRPVVESATRVFCLLGHVEPSPLLHSMS